MDKQSVKSFIKIYTNLVVSGALGTLLWIVTLSPLVLLVLILDKLIGNAL